MFQNKKKTKNKGNVNVFKTPNYKIKLITDSHGRNLRQLINKNFKNNVDVSCVLKPNGKMKNMVDNIDSVVKHFYKNDYVWLLETLMMLNRSSAVYNILLMT